MRSGCETMVRFNNFWLCVFGLFYISAVFGGDSDASFSQDTIQVKLDSGILQGTVKSTNDGQNYYSFQGIPYAQPPLGKLRFRDPVPSKKWESTLNATVQKPGCVELQLRQINYIITGQEDCLYLNVYSSQNPHSIKKALPVMFWIFGGSFREGAAELYGPEFLLKENDVIIVNFNYRLGLFGFLSTQDSNSPGNYGLKDILLALKWTKNNIAKFGGDPNKVTIFGESAGAAVVGYLMMNKDAANLFSNAIMQSGSPLCVWALDMNPRKAAFDLGVSLGLITNSSSTLIRYLRSANLRNKELTIKNVNYLNFAESFSKGGPFGPVLEPNNKNAFLTKDSYKAFQNGDFKKVPVLMGVNSQEGKFFNSLFILIRPLFLLYDISPSSLVRSTMNVNSIKDMRIVGTKIRQFYFQNNSFSTSKNTELTEFLGDDLFVRPALKTAEILSRHVPVYFYVFDYYGGVGKAWLKLVAKENDVKGVPHGTELWYLWKTDWKNVTPKTAEEKLTSRRLAKMWTNFAKFGDPTPTSDTLLQNVKWPMVQGPNVDYLYIGQNVRIGQNFRKRSINFWNDIYANYSKGPSYIY